MLAEEVAAEGVAVAELLLEEVDEEGRPIRPGFWHGEDALEEGWEAPISKKAWGKTPAVEPLPQETDKQLA